MYHKLNKGENFLPLQIRQAVGRLNVAFGSSAIPADRKSFKRFSIIRYQAPNTFANTSNSVFFSSMMIMNGQSVRKKQH
jgi:hypothetical protein